METTEPTQNRKSTGGLEQNLLLHKTNTALASNEVQTVTDEPNEDDEAEPDTNTPEADERAIAATIKEVNRHSNGPFTIIGEVKNPTNQPHIIDAEEEDNPEEETDKIITTGKFKKSTNQPHVTNEEVEDNPVEETDEITAMGKFKISPTRPHIIDVESDNSEDETDEPAHTPEEWVVQDDALPTTPRTTTDDAAPIPPHKRLHRSRYLVRVCGYFTHGIWCDCPFIPKPSPRYHVESNLNVPQTLPTKPRKSDRMK
jgi:hypothetical protein